jgi:hypothetical protein
MMDDVVGLVMVQVISKLGGSSTAIAPATVIRPILVSLAFAVVVPLACRFVVKPVTLLYNAHRERHPTGAVERVLCLRHTAFLIHTAVLLALVTGASYAGTSNLFAAYIAGAVVSWWDDELPHPRQSGDTAPSPDESMNQNQTTDAQPAMIQQHLPRTQASVDGIKTSSAAESDEKKAEGERPDQRPSTPRTATVAEPLLTTGVAVYTAYYHQPVARLLKPFFFASIGFSIPISRLFAGRIIWRGIVYTIIMTFAKMACGLWLIRIPWSTFVPGKLRSPKLKARLPSLPHLWGKRGKPTPPPVTPAEAPAAPQSTTTTTSSTSPTPPKPLSLYPPAILSLAMVARGEIGFLISALAESKGVFASATSPLDEPTDIFLITTTAIFLCTFVSPLCVGLLVRRVRRLEGKREDDGGGKSVLGVWGVQ